METLSPALRANFEFMRDNKKNRYNLAPSIDQSTQTDFPGILPMTLKQISRMEQFRLFAMYVCAIEIVLAVREFGVLSIITLVAAMYGMLGSISKRKNMLWLYIIHVGLTTSGSIMTTITHSQHIAARNAQLSSTLLLLIIMDVVRLGMLAALLYFMRLLQLYGLEVDASKGSPDAIAMAKTLSTSGHAPIGLTANHVTSTSGPKGSRRKQR
eukprot:PhF_6_TR810/c0_g1_i1/m.1236